MPRACRAAFEFGRTNRRIMPPELGLRICGAAAAGSGRGGGGGGGGAAAEALRGEQRADALTPLSSEAVEGSVRNDFAVVYIRIRVRGQTRQIRNDGTGSFKLVVPILEN